MRTMEERRRLAIQNGKEDCRETTNQMTDMETETQLQDPLAHQIIEAYEAGQAAVANARETTQDAMAKMLEVGALTETAFERDRRGFADWWREQIGDRISIDNAKALIRVTRMARTRPADHAQLKLLGILDAPEHDREDKPQVESDGMAWHRKALALGERAAKLQEQVAADAAIMTEGLRELAYSERVRIARQLDDASQMLADAAEAVRGMGN